MKRLRKFLIWLQKTNDQEDSIKDSSLRIPRHLEICFFYDFISIDGQSGDLVLRKEWMFRTTWFLSHEWANLYCVYAMAISRFHFMKWADSCVHKHGFMNSTTHESW